jgi:hypothetical protein
MHACIDLLVSPVAAGQARYRDARFNHIAYDLAAPTAWQDAGIVSFTCFDSPLAAVESSLS